MKGTEPFDLFGNQLDMTPNGTTLVVGAPLDYLFNDHGGFVEVYKLNESSWNIVGSRIQEDQFGLGFGISVAISDSGDALLIGAWNYSSLVTTGALFHYKFNGTEWEREFRISGPGLRAGALAGDDSALVYSIPALNNATGRVFSETIDGDFYGNDITGLEEWVYSGSAITLSGNAQFLAIGAPGHYVEVFEHGGFDWALRAPQHLIVPPEQPTSTFGLALSLSDDGNRVAIGDYLLRGGRGSVFVYQFNEAGLDSTWQILGKPVRGANNENLGRSVSLSGDGSVLVLGAAANVDNATCPVARSLRVFRFDYTQNDWVEYGIVEGNPGFCPGRCVVSKDGTIIACGDFPNDVGDARSGTVRVYALK